jgi:small subunit ribosomal protein S20
LTAPAKQKPKEKKKLSSAEKALKQSRARAMRNKSIRSGTKTAISKAKAAIGSGNAQQSLAAVKEAFSAIGKARSKGVLHRRTAARKESRLAKLAAKLTAG